MIQSYKLNSKYDAYRAILVQNNRANMNMRSYFGYPVRYRMKHSRQICPRFIVLFHLKSKQILRRGYRISYILLNTTI